MRRYPPPQPITEPEKIPPGITSDYCLRCMRPFDHNEICPFVTGGPEARYREIGINICTGCQQGRGLDIQEYVSVYVKTGRPLPLDNSEAMRPILYASKPNPGYVKLSLLENGFWRIGLHRGHAEIWSEQDFKNLGQSAMDSAGEFAYSANYGIYGPLSLLSKMEHIKIHRVEFLDLRCFHERKMRPFQARRTK